TSGHISWLRWITPLGWAEEMRPFTGTRPEVLLLPLIVSAVLIGLALRTMTRRDIGSGLLAAHDSAPPRLRLLSSPTAQAFRGERVSLLIWFFGVGAFAFIVGVISKSISTAGISKQLQQELAKLGTGSVLTPKGYIAFSFLFFVLVISLFVVAQVAAARHEEADERLETLLALPLARVRWLGGRAAIAVLAALGLSMAAGVLAWAGATSQGVGISLSRMLE